MIVPMERLTLLCLDSARESVLTALRDLGCVHVRVETRDSETLRRAAAAVAAAELALRVLTVAEADGTFAFKPDAASPVAALAPEALAVEAEALAAVRTAADVTRAAELITRLRDEAQNLRTQLRRYAPFSSVDPSTVTALQGKGLAVRLYRCPESVPAGEGNDFTLGTEAGFRYGVRLGGDALPEGYEAVPLPERSTAAMADEAARDEAAAARLVTLIADAAESLRPLLSRNLEERRRDNVVATVAENLRAEGPIACLAGYVPKRLHDTVVVRAEAEGWGVVLEEPDPDDAEVPVLLEAPRGFRAIGALFSGLGILPGYIEGDISVPFYLFFSLFFAMLIGDAGYGLVMLAGVLLAALRLRKKTAAKPVLQIFTVFALSTILWGVLSGTYFGIAKAALPAVLREIPTVDWLGQDSNVMFLCFLIGAVHISVARLWNAVLLLPGLKALGELGWLGVTWSMFMIVSGIVVEWFTQPGWAWWLLGGSVAAILVPMVADIRREGISIGMLPLNVISAMGDIISYVRLFAVGLASVKVAENFNAMAFQLDLPLVLRVVAVCIILLLGHGLNLAMGALSILVHAVRLNTLEFSNAKGVTWSGVPYTPFKQPQQ